MLTQETKRHIDSARQVLVGVVPNPTSQIDQITNALIYKFMDDMDQESIKMGGSPSFFTGDLEKYAWTRLMDTRVGNQERMNLYGEALVRFSESKQLPVLFRDIFRSAFLPYRSPEVLGLFLKEIAYFDYSHSEELGNAYEYLLSIMSSQGDAGQFRTPRHIIDFMVEVVNPTKEDKILDPACGTAGFLISAFKHIRAQHDGKDDSGAKNEEKPLTPDERKMLMGNFEGYDIDPGMVRIAQVNMYLHGFHGPKIFQYDSLSLDDHWNDKFDVILANPPFMSPKGGIRPHSKFGIQSNRSEVLFVDYIMNHLRPKGRAAIIVPEGIIFQSGTAYKQLRKNLVEDGLFAVVSLPSGVFNPYAGVKTSILFFDNEIAKSRNELLFVKVEHDGFSLGAQRKPIEKNDLHEAVEILRAWKQGNIVETKIAAYVEKIKIAEGGDYNLSSDRYKTANTGGNEKWPMVELGSVCSFEYGKPLKAEDRVKGEYPVFGSNGVVGYHNKYLVEGPFVIVGRKGTAGAVTYSEVNGYPIDTTFYVRINPGKNVDLKYLYFLLRMCGLDKVNTQAGVPGLNRNDAYKKLIPLPSLELQKVIVEEIEAYQKIIDGARQVVENWKPRIEVDNDWENVRLGDLFHKLETGVSVNSESRQKGEGEKGVLKTSSVTYGVFNPLENKAIRKDELFKAKVNPRKDNILISRMNTEQLVGATAYVDRDWEDLFLPDRLWQTVRSRDDFSMRYVFYILSSQEYRELLSNMAGGTSGSMKNISQVDFLNIEIPLPPLNIQEKIVKRIKEEQELIDATNKLITINTHNIAGKLSKLWTE